MQRFLYLRENVSLDSVPVVLAAASMRQRLNQAIF